MTRCVRCGDSIVHGAPERFQVELSDRADNETADVEGALCVPCWNDLRRFMSEDCCSERWATA